MSAKDHKTLDVRGTACPMNYVKVMMALKEMEPGEWLDVILVDGRALVDVPRRAREDGHKVQKVIPADDGFCVTIEKG